MAELAELQVQYTQGVITGNFEDLKGSLTVKMEDYQNVVYTADTVKEGKKDIAELRKLRKVLDDKRKEIKKTWNDPYKEFEDKVKEMIELIDKPIEEISSQLEAFEQERIEKKKNQIDEYYNSIFTSEQMEYCPLDKIFNDKWLNSTCSLKSIKEDLVTNQTAVVESLKAIENNCVNCPEIEDKAREEYRKTGELLKAFEFINQYNAKKADEERIRREEQERIRREEQERVHKEEEERIRKEEQEKAEAEKKEAEAKAKVENERLGELAQESTESGGFSVATSQPQGFNAGFSENLGVGGFVQSEQPAQGFDAGFDAGFNTGFDADAGSGFDAGFDTEQPAKGFSTGGFTQTDGFTQQNQARVVFTVFVTPDKAEQLEGLLKVWGYDFQRKTV